MLNFILATATDSGTQDYLDDHDDHDHDDDQDIVENNAVAGTPQKCTTKNI